MEVTLDMIIMVVTALVTAIFGMITKKFDLDLKQYIPIQNIIIGILAGIIVYSLELNTNILNSIVMCSFSALTAGGAYDLYKVNK